MSRIPPSIRWSHLLQAALIASLLLRSLIAPGYMPRTLDTSGPLALCHSGLNEAIGQLLFGSDADHAHHGHHHHTEHRHGHSDSLQADEAATPAALTSTELCPLGDGLNPVLISWASSTDFPFAAASRPVKSKVRWIRTTAASPFLARAPPIVFLLS